MASRCHASCFTLKHFFLPLRALDGTQFDPCLRGQVNPLPFHPLLCPSSPSSLPAPHLLRLLPFLVSFKQAVTSIPDPISKSQALILCLCHLSPAPGDRTVEGCGKRRTRLRSCPSWYFILPRVCVVTVLNSTGSGVCPGTGLAVLVLTCCVCLHVPGCLSLAHAPPPFDHCPCAGNRSRGGQRAGWGASASLLYSGDGMGFKEITFPQE